jgi:hypothetical protein
MTIHHFDTPVPHAPFGVAALTMAAVTMVVMAVVPALIGSGRLPNLPAPVIIAAGGDFPDMTIEVVATRKSAHAAARCPPDSPTDD